MLSYCIYNQHKYIHTRYLSNDDSWGIYYTNTEKESEGGVCGRRNSYNENRFSVTALQLVRFWAVPLQVCIGLPCLFFLVDSIQGLPLLCRHLSFWDYAVSNLILQNVISVAISHWLDTFNTSSLLMWLGLSTQENVCCLTAKPVVIFQVSYP